MAARPALAIHLLELFARGHLSGTQVQGTAKAAFDDGWGAGSDLAYRLAHAGAAGTRSGHVVEALFRAARLAGLMSGTAQPYMLELPSGKGVVEIFLPHEVYHNIAAEHGTGPLCLSPEELQDPRGLGALLHEWVDHRDVRDHCGPGDLGRVAILGFHSDGVGYTTTLRAGGTKGVMAASLNVVSAGTEQLRNLRRPLFTIAKTRLCPCGCKGFCTYQAVMEVLSWSFGFLTKGYAPSCRHNGEPWSDHDRQTRLPDGARLEQAALLQVRGDWENLEEMFRVRSVNSQRFCWLCDTVKTRSDPLTFHDFRPEAAHRTTAISHETYMQTMAQDMVQPSKLFLTPGLELKHLTVDSMHAGDLGCFQDALGSLFFLEINCKAWYRNRSVGLQHLNTQLEAYYAANLDRRMSKVTPLAMTQILCKSVGYPYLKAKAAATRHLAHFGLMLSRKHMHGGEGRGSFQLPARHRLSGRVAEHCRLMVSAFEGLVLYTDSCSPFSEEGCRSGMYKFLQSLEALHVMWRVQAPLAKRKSQPFNVRQKAHALQHLVEDKLVLWGSPARFWNYRDEDYIGAIKVMAGRTKHPHTLERRLAQKLILLGGLHAAV
jgi:hypothetical protein